MSKLNMSSKIVVAGLTTALITAGCANSVSSTAPVSATLTMTGSSQPTTLANYKKAPWLYKLLSPTAVALAPPAMTDSGTRVIALNKAWVIVKEIEFKLAEAADAGEVAGSEVKFRGPYFVDLLSTTPASFGSAEVPAGVYRRVKMKLEKDSALPAGAPTQLAGNSIYLEGTVSGLAFTYSAPDGTEFKIAGPGGVSLTATSNMVIGVKVSDLFRLINMDAVAAAANKNISDANRISTGSVSACPSIDPSVRDIAACLRKGLEKAGKFGKDDNGDGEIGTGEAEVHG